MSVTLCAVANSEFCPNVQTVRDVELLLLLESSSFEMSYAAAHLLVCPFGPLHNGFKFKMWLQRKSKTGH